MTFQPEVNQELTVDGTPFRVAEHPAARGMPYGQEGRQATVYCLQAPSGERRAIKAFKPRFRVPSMVSLAKRLAFFADLPGLAVCRRTVLTPQHHANLLRQFPDLLYGVVMPWVEGPTWMETVVERQELSPEQSLRLARSFAVVLASMEQEGLAHCDLSGPNILIPMLAPTYEAGRDDQGVALVDVEQMYGPDLKRPEVVPGGSPGYAHKMAPEGMWETDADRLAGAVLLAEMISWWDPEVRAASWGESFFDPTEMQRASHRAEVMFNSLRQRWGEGVVQVFDRAWRSDTLSECPTFGEWLVVLPETVGSAVSRSTVAAVPSPADLKAAIEAADAGPVAPIVRELMDQAEVAQTEGDVLGAMALYKEARSLSVEGSRLSRQLVLIIEDLERKQRGEAAPAATPSTAPVAPEPEPEPGVEERPDPIVNILMSQASDFEEEGRLDPALQSYREALSLVPVRSRVAEELRLIVSALEQKLAEQGAAASSVATAPAAEVAPSVEVPAPQTPPVVEPARPEPDVRPQVVEQAPVARVEEAAPPVVIDVPPSKPEEPAHAAPLDFDRELAVAPIVAELMAEARKLEQASDLREALANYREARSLAPQGSPAGRELDALIGDLEARQAAPVASSPTQPAAGLSELLAAAPLVAEPSAAEPVAQETATREPEQPVEEAPPPAVQEFPVYKPEERTAAVPVQQYEPEPEREAQPQLPSYRPGAETAPPPPDNGPVLPSFKPGGETVAPAAEAAALASAAQIDPIVWQLVDEAQGLNSAGQPERALAMYREAQSLVPEGSEYGRDLAQKVHDLEERLKISPRVVAPMPRDTERQPQFGAPAVAAAGFDLGAALSQAGSVAPAAQPGGSIGAGQAAYPPQPAEVTSGVPGGFLDTYYDMGLAAYNRGDWAQASQLLGEVVKRQPDYKRDGQPVSDLLVDVERQKSAANAPKGKKDKAAKPAPKVAATAAATVAVTTAATEGVAASTGTAAITSAGPTTSTKPKAAKPRTSEKQGGRNLLVPIAIAVGVVILLLAIGGFLLLGQGNKNNANNAASLSATATAGTLAHLETTATAVAVGAQSTRQAAFAGVTETVVAARSTATAQAGAYVNSVKATQLDRTLEGTTYDVRTVAFSPDGTMLAAGGYDQNVVLWKVADWSIMKVLTGSVNSIISLTFTPDSKTVAAADDGGKLWLWDVASGTSRQLDHGHRTWSIAVSPDGKTLASGSGTSQDEQGQTSDDIKLWNLADGTLLHKVDLPNPENKGNYTRGLAFSPDGTLLASGSQDQIVRLWRVADASTILTLTGHTAPVYAVAFSPDGKILASGSADKSVRLWKMPEGSPLLKLENHDASVTGVAFSPDGRLLAGGSADSTITIWAVGDGSLLTTLKEPTNKTTSVAFSPDGKLLTSGSGSGIPDKKSWDGKVRIWAPPAK